MVCVGGIFPAIVGTVFPYFGYGGFALPLGILSAVYLVEYAQEEFSDTYYKVGDRESFRYSFDCLWLVWFCLVCDLSKTRYFDPGRFADLGDHEPAGDHYCDERAP